MGAAWLFATGFRESFLALLDWIGENRRTKQLRTNEAETLRQTGGKRGRKFSAIFELVEGTFVAEWLGPGVR
jgi:hypothetical protein